MLVMVVVVRVRMDGARRLGMLAVTGGTEVGRRVKMGAIAAARVMIGGMRRVETGARVTPTDAEQCRWSRRAQK